MPCVHYLALFYFAIFNTLNREKFFRNLLELFFNQDLVFSYYELTRDLLNDEPLFNYKVTGKNGDIILQGYKKDLVNMLSELLDLPI